MCGVYPRRVTFVPRRSQGFDPSVLVNSYKNHGTVGPTVAIRCDRVQVYWQTTCSGLGVRTRLAATS